MQDVVNDILVELRFGAGQDVQIHLQEGIVANVSRLYRTLMKKHVWRDFYATTALTMNSTTGQANEDLTGIVTRFSDILAVYRGSDENPLPIAPVMTNPARLRRPALVPSNTAKLFTMYPFEEVDAYMITRSYDDSNFDMTDEIPFYRDVLALGGAYMLSVKVGTNEALTVSLLKQFDELLNIYTMAELQSVYQLNTHRGQFPTEWYENGR